LIGKDLETGIPLVSIIIPSYNHAKWISSALDSVLNQTYSNWEVVIVDNCSTDSTDSVLSNYNDNRIKILKVSNKGSIALSRNVGLSIASGVWIAFLDSDDYWTENKLEECSNFFYRGTDLIYHDLRIISATEQNTPARYIRSRKLRKPIFLDLLLHGNTISTSSVVVRSEIIKKVGGMRENLDLIGVEDYNTWLRISQITNEFRHINRILGTYRIHGSNSSSSTSFEKILRATTEFSSLLTQKQKKIFEASLLYGPVRQSFLNRDYKNITRNLKYVIRFGTLSRKIRAMWMFTIVFFSRKRKMSSSFTTQSE
jgi:glycosyltransferase involved in cell wall biosynthesis